MFLKERTPFKTVLEICSGTKLALNILNGYDKTPQGWIKDKYLTQEIEKAITSTESKDVIYTVSVQGHGSYPSDVELEDQKIFITDGITGDMKNSWEYFIYQINEMDTFIGQLIEL
jgi:phosphoglycerol transferase MdoB-like AlkP superfamily enzyme